MNKIIKLLVVAFALTFTTLVTAQTESKNIDMEYIFRQMPFDVEEDLIAKAYITFNEDNRIVEVNVLCNNNAVKNFLETRLIHSRVKGESIKANKIYSLPIRILSKPE